MQKIIEVYKIPLILSNMTWKEIIYKLTTEKLPNDWEFFNSLDKKSKDYKLNELNLYKNCYVYNFCKIQDVETNAVMHDSFNLHRYKETGGWFLFPIEEEISISGFYKTHDENMTAIYDKYFDRYFPINILTEETRSFYFEAVSAYKNDCFYACVCSLFPVLEWYTRRLSKFNKHIEKYSQKAALGKVVGEIANESYLSPRAIKTLQEVYTRITEFVKENYYKSSQEDDSEPEIICRNRIMHGIFTRTPNKTDCLKLFHVIRAFHYLEYTYTAIQKIKEFDGKIKKLKKELKITIEESIYDEEAAREYAHKHSPFKLPNSKKVNGLANTK